MLITGRERVCPARAGVSRHPARPPSRTSGLPRARSVPLFFPSLASLPIEQVRRAVAEYFRTGRRPDCVQRQPGDWY
ncbi:Imm1 family immunity protein [Actinoalloteichus sp. AHMU CJ021]|uniref:Imm1 family immunity protein n=1 Tax=Actinoalloteichus sp. AHMU CJ021 TaxID=2072503 RepID=UPI003FCDDCCB